VDPFLNTVIGEYRVTALIGEGGMGRVYRALHTRLGRVAAVKILTAASGDRTFLQRFLNEAQIQSRLRDPGIATLYDYTEYRGNPVIIMEYIDGYTIQQIIESNGAWPVERALPVLRACARTLEYVHSQRVVHRDFKSANVKVTSSGEVKLIDFGIATGPAAQRLTTAGFVIGTFQSLSPEQTRGEPATASTDIWAFGVLAYEMLTASLPFEGSNAAELFSKISRANFTAPTVLRPGLPIALEQVIRRCLRRDPKDRYPSMKEISSDLTRIYDAGLDGGTKLTFPEIPGKHRRFVLGAALLAICAVLIVGYSIGHWRASGAGSATSNADSGAAGAGGESGAANTGNAADSGSAAMHTVTVDTFDGPAEVWENGVKVGETPYQFRRPFGASVNAVLRRPGFADLPINFDVDERSSYVFTLDRSPSQ